MSFCTVVLTWYDGMTRHSRNVRIALLHGERLSEWSILCALDSIMRNCMDLTGWPKGWRQQVIDDFNRQLAPPLSQSTARKGLEE